MREPRAKELGKTVVIDTRQVPVPTYFRVLIFSSSGLVTEVGEDY
jgi:hypothetical protein